jgi:hypothetical protein
MPPHARRRYHDTTTPFSELCNNAVRQPSSRGRVSSTSEDTPASGSCRALRSTRHIRLRQLSSTSAKPLVRRPRRRYSEIACAASARSAVSFLIPCAQPPRCVRPVMPCRIDGGCNRRCSSRVPPWRDRSRQYKPISDRPIATSHHAAIKQVAPLPSETSSTHPSSRDWTWVGDLRYRTPGSAGARTLRRNCTNSWRAPITIGHFELRQGLDAPGRTTSGDTTAYGPPAAFPASTALGSGDSARFWLS